MPLGQERVVEQVDLLVNVYDPKGNRRAGERLNARIALRPDDRVADVSYEVLSRVDLPAGRYQVRLAASSSMQGKSGSVFLDVDVPDFSTGDVSMSGVLLSVTPGPPAAPKDKLASLVPVVPTTERTFTGSDRVVAFARVYQGGKKALAPVTLTSRIVDGRGTAVFDATESVGADRFSANRAADYRLDLPLARLAPGLHLLTIDAQSGKVTARRAVRFVVR